MYEALKNHTHDPMIRMCWVERPVPKDAKTGGFTMGPAFSVLLFIKIEASVWLKSLLLCLVGDFYFEEEGGNFRSSEVKVRSKSWQLFKINVQPHHKGFSVTLETPFQKNELE